MSTQYRLPCPQCAEVHLVEAARAGVLVTCSCGCQFNIPTWRELRQFEQVDQADESSSNWGAPQAVMLVSALVAIVCLGLAAVRVARLPPEPQVDRVMSFEQIRQLSPAESWEYYQHMRQGLQSLDEIEAGRGIERQVSAFRTFRQRFILWNYVLVACGVAGLVVAGVALAQIPRRRATTSQ